MLPKAGAATRIVVALGSVLLLPLRSTAAGAQQALSRAQAIQAALERGPRMAVARADTTVAFAQLMTAQAFPNPSLNATYTKDAPQYHITAAFPFDFGRIRSARSSAAESGRLASILRYRYQRAAIAFDADTTYTRALAAVAHTQLSRRNAQDADSLRRIAVQRRDAGDASELDVELATVSAGQQANAAVADSLVMLATLLDLQTLLGVPSPEVTIALSDSLAPPAQDGVGQGAGSPLLVAAAEANLTAADYGRLVQRRSVWILPTIEGGVEFGEPGIDRGVLPTVGLAFPLPLFNRNQGPILAADAEHVRAQAELELVRLESQVRITRSLRHREVAFGKLERDRVLLESANRVVTMSIQAYQEGAAPLATVLEAQRTAREVLGQYIDDMAGAWIAVSAVRLHTLRPSQP